MKESLYNIANNRLTRMNGTGYDYEEKIFRKTMSPYLFRDPTRSDILTELEKTVFFLVEKAKYVRNFINYTVDKDSKQLN